VDWQEDLRVGSYGSISSNLNIDAADSNIFAEPGSLRNIYCEAFGERCFAAVRMEEGQQQGGVTRFLLRATGRFLAFPAPYVLCRRGLATISRHPS